MRTPGKHQYSFPGNHGIPSCYSLAIHLLFTFLRLSRILARRFAPRNCSALRARSLGGSGGFVARSIQGRRYDRSTLCGPYPARAARRENSCFAGVRDSWIGACGGRAYQRAPWRVAHVNINSVDHWRPHPRKAGDGVR